MRILGIDPGSGVAGYGIIQKQEEEKGSLSLEALDYGSIKMSQKKSFAQKLLFLYEHLSKIIAEYQITEVAIERAFYGKNVDSALKLGQVRGACLLLAAQKSLPVYEYAPTQIKKRVTGQGNANKDHVQLILFNLLGLSAQSQSLPSLDASDALAIAFTHAQEHIVGAKKEKLMKDNLL